MRHALAHVAAGWSVAFASLIGVAIARRQHQTQRGAGRRDAHCADAMSNIELVITRPCAGAPGYLEDTLRSTLLAKTRLTRRVIFSVAFEDDPALPTLQRVAKALNAAGLESRVQIVDPGEHPNHKVAQLAGVTAHLRDGHTIILNVDSDVDLSGVDLDVLIAPLLAKRVAACWAPTIEVAAAHAHRLGDRASAAYLNTSLHAFPLLSGLDPTGLVGKVFAIRADALAQVGGFAAFTRYLGEDMALSQRLRGAGYRVEPSPLVTHSRAVGRTLPQALARFSRWVMVIRAQRPALMASYPLLLAAAPPLLLLGAWSRGVDPQRAAWTVGVTTAARTAAAVAARKFAGQPVDWRRLPADMALGDGLLWAAWMRALSTREVTWSGRTLRIDDTGRLEAMD